MQVVLEYFAAAQVSAERRYMYIQHAHIFFSPLLHISHLLPEGSEVLFEGGGHDRRVGLRTREV